MYVFKHSIKKLGDAVLVSVLNDWAWFIGKNLEFVVSDFTARIWGLVLPSYTHKSLDHSIIKIV